MSLEVLPDVPKQVESFSHIERSIQTFFKDKLDRIKELTGVTTE